MRKIVIDNIDREAEIARLDIDGDILTISTDFIPIAAKPGDVLKFTIDRRQTDIEKSKISELEKKLFIR